MQLEIPDLTARNQEYDRYLPATAQHPKASSRFRSIPSKARLGITDLGLWNVFANPDMPGPQAKLNNILCEQAKQRDIKQCTEEHLLPLSIAAFKTPVLRDLGHSNPYMHTGQFNSVKDSITFYITASALAKSKQLRNADPALRDISIKTTDVDALVAFVNALNEDYE